MSITNLLCTTPDEAFGTIAELNGGLVAASKASDLLTQELAQTPLYPAIQYEAIEATYSDFDIPQAPVVDYFGVAYQYILSVVKNQWESHRPLIENNLAYKIAQAGYNQITKSPHLVYNQHPAFNTSNTEEIRCLAWHPHKDVIAVAHKSNQVYVYEKQGEAWHCQVLAHPHMKNITCIEWKSRASGILAIGCQQGVCIWTLGDSTGSSKPVYHNNASMEYIKTGHDDAISSMAWDPTPGSFLLACVSAVSNSVVIHDLLLNRTTPLKRYGKGNVLLRWSPSGEFLFEGGSGGISRMWDTSDWSSQQINNPPGLWVQTACWSPDNRTLFYSMCGKCDVHVLFLTGKSVKHIHDDFAQSTPETTVTSQSGQDYKVGGVIRDMTMEQTHGQRLAIAYEKSPLIALYSVKHISPLNVRRDPIFFPIGYVRGAETSCKDNHWEFKSVNSAYPTHITFNTTYKQGSILATAWDNGTVTFVTHNYLTDEQVKMRFM